MKAMWLILAVCGCMGGVWGILRIAADIHADRCTRNHKGVSRKGRITA
jgi:hypothetical protein